MKLAKSYLFILSLVRITGINLSGQEFSVDDYLSFRQKTAGIDQSQLGSWYMRPAEYYLKGFEDLVSFENVGYLDSINQKLNLTTDETDLLKNNLFFYTHTKRQKPLLALLPHIRLIKIGCGQGNVPPLYLPLFE